MAGFVLHNQKPIILSMVERNRQPLAVGCLPKLAVFHPVMLYRQSVERLAVVPENITLELSAMIYKFLFTGSRFRIAVYANSLNEALARLPKAHQRPVLISRIKGACYA
ncbi:hypothetical protein [Rodentibacter caecimuris]|uniref:hypothetical protein n=1 Tax=Rodentibacter caecimuris TaxID=1796644 RepID=UPI00211A7636|nr:hypothetical protein [Rodentibacter heylii]MCQ9123304.1 hypothetical protein [Rodentibacter heylii]